MTVPINIVGGVTITGGVNIGGALSNPTSFSISGNDFSNIGYGYGAEGDSTGFGIGGDHGSGEAAFFGDMNVGGGANSAKIAELIAFWNNNDLDTNSAYLFDVSWGAGSSTNTTRNVAAIRFSYSDVNQAYVNIGVVDTNNSGWDTPGLNTFSDLRAANGTFLFPATFTLIQPAIQDINSWC